VPPLPPVPPVAPVPPLPPVPAGGGGAESEQFATEAISATKPSRRSTFIYVEATKLGGHRSSAGVLR